MTLEGLLDAASGVVVFQFAILALTTGSFSFVSAGTQFVWALVGGMLAGLFLAFCHLGLVSLL